MDDASTSRGDGYDALEHHNVAEDAGGNAQGRGSHRYARGSTPSGSISSASSDDNETPGGGGDLAASALGADLGSGSGGGMFLPGNNSGSVPAISAAHASIDSSVRQQQETLRHVYENMTQSSTPHQPTGDPPSQQQRQRQPQAWAHKNGGRVGNIQIPPVPDIPSEMPASGGDGAPRRSSRRKRTVAAAGLDGADISSARNRNDAADEVASTTSGGSRGSSSRKKPAPTSTSSSSGRTRRKWKNGNKDGSDARWSKRFTWPEELHRDFVSAVFDVGLKHASPSTIIERMPGHEELTVERIKSHLQKYRIHREKSKRDFMRCYDESLAKIRSRGGSSNTFRSLSSGEVAAHLAHSSMADEHMYEEGLDGPVSESAGSRKKPAHEASKGLGEGADESGQRDSLVVPRLTDEEKKSPIGASMGYLMGLFFSLKQQLMAERESKKQKSAMPSLSAMAPSGMKQNVPVAAAFESFSGVAPPEHPSPPRYEAAPSHYQVRSPSMSARCAPVIPSASALSTSAPTTVANPSSRSNLEESNMMKAEMQNQMAFQNKMRALKQQEFNKYRRHGGVEQSDLQQQQQQHVPYHRQDVFPEDSTTDAGGDITGATASKAAAVDFAQQELQGAGETAAAPDTETGHNRDRPRGMSFGISDSDFWNTDVMDEQLFEFLLNN